MTASLLHVVTTRMLCKLRPWHDEAYINRRLDIFELFTLPSLRQQTSRNFHWLLLVNPALPEACKVRLQRMIDGSHNIHIIHTDIRKELHNQLEYARAFEDFLADIGGSHDYLLSSRIDSDDCWNIRYVETLQARVRDLLTTVAGPADFRGALLTFPRGVVCYPYEIRSMYGLVDCRKSYWSTSVDMLTGFGMRQPPYRFPHSKARKVARSLGLRRVKIATPEPMWLYLQHDLNFALTDSYRWFRWFKLVERLFFRSYPFSDERLGLFALDRGTIEAFARLPETRQLLSAARPGARAAGDV